MIKQVSFVAAMLAFSAATAFAESPFAGTWKQNRAKTQRDPRLGILKIESDGNGGILYVSLRPIYGGPLDGSKRPGLETMASDTFTLQKLSERSYSATLSRNGVDVQRELVEVSADGKTLTDSFTRMTPRKDGKQPTDVHIYDRTGGDGKPYPFLGVWKQDRKRTKWGEDPAPMIISEAGGVLTMSNPVAGSKTTIDLQKSEVTSTGAANPATDITRSVRKIGERSFEMTITRRGVAQKSVYEVSANGKTLSIRSSMTDADGKPRSATSYFDRQ